MGNLLDLIGEESYFNGERGVRAADNVGGRTVSAGAEEEDLGLVGVLFADRLSRRLEEASIVVNDVGYGDLNGLVDLLLRALLVVLDESAIVEALETFEWSNVDEDVNVTDENTHTLAVVIFSTLGFSVEVTEAGALMRGGDHLLLTADHAHLVAEQVVRDTNNEAFSEEGPVEERAVTDHSLGDGLGLGVLVSILDCNDHADALRFRLEDVDAMMTKATIVGKRFERGETG